MAKKTSAAPSPPPAKAAAKEAVGANASPKASPKAAVGATAAVGADAPAVKPWAEIVAPLANSVACETYIMELKKSVDQRLTARLQSAPAVGGINMEGELAKQEPLQILERPQELSTYKEHWRWETANMALKNTGLYEAPGNAFWFSLAPATWEGEGLPATGLTFGQVASGRLLFSDEKFKRSAEDISKRHYFISAAIPTAVVSLADVPADGGKGFLNLPCLGTRAVLAGWYSVMDDALRNGDTHKIKKLVEAALSMPMRLRAGPDRKQVMLDSITYSEDLFAIKTATSDAFLDFSAKVINLFPPSPAFGGLQVPQILATTKSMALTFHGNALGDNAARALQWVAPYVSDTRLMTAYKELENKTQELNDQTKISTMFNAASKMYGKGSPAAVGALTALADGIRYGLIFKDIARDRDLTVAFLTGKAKKAQG